MIIAAERRSRRGDLAQVAPRCAEAVLKRMMQDGSPSPQGRVDARSAAGWGRPQSRISTKIARSLRKRLTPHEAQLWLRLRALRPAGFHFRRQVPIGEFVVDFACLKHRLVVELDGGGHTSRASLGRDRSRDLALTQSGFQVLRFWTTEVRTNIEDVLETILSKTRQTPPASLRSAPSPDGREG